MLNLTDRPEPPASETHSHPRLVVSGRPVTFSVPKNTEVPWWVRAVGITIGVIISGAAVLAIIYSGAFIKHVYEVIDARQKALAEQRRSAPKPPEGAIPIVIPEDRPTADDDPAPEEDHPPENEEPGVPPT